MKHRIVRNIRRADAEEVKILGKLGVATVHEAQGRTGLLAPYMRPIYNSARVAGPAVTVLCQAGDNLMIHAAVELCQAGDVLVVTCTAESTDGMFGDLLATSLQIARRRRAGDQCRRARRRRPDRHGFPGVGESHLGAGNGESDPGIGQRPGDLRRSS